MSRRLLQVIRHRFVQVGDVRGVMFIVMNFHRPRVNVRFQSVDRVRQGRETERNAGRSDEQCVLELGRARAIECGCRPSVVPDASELPAALVDHGLDRERHSGGDHGVGHRVEVVRNGGRGVELLTNSVTDERAHHREAGTFGVRLDRAPDLVEPSTWTDLIDALPQCFLGHLHQEACIVVDLTDAEGRVGVAVHAVQVDRDIAVDDVAVDEHAVVRDAVADHLIDRRAQRLREALVMQRARIAAAGDTCLVANAIELVGRDAGPHGILQLE